MNCFFITIFGLAIPAFVRFTTLVPEVFLDFSLRKRSRASREAATRSCESDEEREKNLWLPWPRISLSCRRQGQDLTLGRWLVDIFSNTQTNLIGSFNCNYRGDAEDFYTLFLKVNFASLYQGRKLFVYCTRNNICTGPRHVKALHISRFWHGCCSWKNIRRIFDLGTWWALSWVSLSNKWKRCSPPWVEKMCSPFNQPDMESILQVPYLKRLLIPSPCNNFACLSSQVCCGLAYPRTAKQMTTFVKNPCYYTQKRWF